MRKMLKGLSILQMALISMHVSAVLGLVSAVFNFSCGWCGLKGEKGGEKQPVCGSEARVAWPDRCSGIRSTDTFWGRGYRADRYCCLKQCCSGIVSYFRQKRKKGQVKLAIIPVKQISICAAPECLQDEQVESEEEKEEKSVKKMVRNLAVIAGGIALACCLLLAGCKKDEPKTEVIIESEGQMEGTLVSFEGRTLVVEEAGEDYTFDVSGASVNTKNMRAGDELVIYYDGKLRDSDTSKVKVTSIEDLGENEHQTEKQAVGTLVDLTENTITIRQNDGEELLFNANNCQHEFKNGIREGNWVVVTYIGEIQGKDTKNVTVIKITDNDPNTVKKEQKKMKIKAVNEKVYTTAGVHIRESYTTDSKVLGSLAKGKSAMRTGVCENGWSRIQYKSADAYVYGEYLTTKKPKKGAPAAKTNGKPAATPQEGDDPQPVAEKLEASMQPAEEEGPEEIELKQPKGDVFAEELGESVKDPAQDSSGQSEEAVADDPERPEEEEDRDVPERSKVQTFTGTVLEVNMNTLTVARKDQEYTLDIADAEHEYANGIQTGNTVTVTYVGNLEDLEHLVVTKVEDSDPNEAAKNAVYAGTIIDATMNTLTIQTEDGAVMTFIKEDAVNNLEAMSYGQKVKITADMTASKAEENVFQAKQIDPADSE